MNNVDTNSASVIECVLREHRALMRQYGEAQTRCSLLATAQAAEIERLRAEVLRLRAAAVVMRRTTAADSVQWVG